MNDLKKWMVGLDLTDHDDHLIGYTHYLAQSFMPEEIVFIHIKKRNEIPDRFRKQKDYTREELKKMIEKKVYSIFQDTARVFCEVHEGTPYFDIWRETYLHHTDLFIAGEKDIEFGRKIVPEKFIRKSFCSVLFVPMEAKEIKSIWVPVDFSDNSKDAVEVAIQAQHDNHTSDITCHYVFETPSLSMIKEDLRDEYIDYYREESEKKMDAFLSGIENSHEVKRHYSPWTEVDVARHVKEEAEKNNADIIIMSSGGKTRFSSLFLGSTTSELLRLEKTIPLLILKQKINKVRAWDILTHL